MNHTAWMICSLAKELRNGELAVVGNYSPIPAAAVLLAGLCHAPELRSVILGMEQEWPFGSAQEFYNLVQRGDADVFFLSGAQIDAYGSVNLHAIGDYESPAVRLPGGAGAAMFYYRCKRIYLFKQEHDPKGFPERLDFVTSSASPAYREQGLGRLEAVYTPLAVMRPSGPGGRLQLAQTAPGVHPDEAIARTGFRLEPSGGLTEAGQLDPEMLRLLRNVVKPQLSTLYPQFASTL